MISDKQFSEDFSGFWAGCLPFLTPQAVAQLNLRGTSMPAGNGFVVKPLIGSSPNSNSDVVAEAAFGLFATAVQRKVTVVSVTRDGLLLESVIAGAVQRISAYRAFGNAVNPVAAPSVADATELAIRLENYFSAKEFSTLAVQPRFKGSGILNSCYGDLLCDDCLYEVKMVDRNLRGVDLRQVLTYCALNSQSQQAVINSVAILNPRRGIIFQFNLDELAHYACRKTAAELFHEIIGFLGSFEAVHRAS